MQLVHKFVIVFLSMVVLSACVTTRSELNEKRDQQGEDSSAKHENSSVKSEDISSIEPAVVENTKANETIPSAVVVAAPSPVRPTPLIPVPANSQYGMEEMRAELAKLSGKVEEMEQDKKNQQQAQLEEQNKLQAKIDDLAKQLKEKEEANNGPAIPEGKTPLQAAKDAFFASNYELAIQFLDPFLKNNDSGKDVEEGAFVRGESFYKLKQYKKAIVDYSKFSDKYQKSKFSSKALLKVAECFEALEMKDDAKAFYQDLFDKYPKTVEGKLAKKKLSGKSSKK